MRYYHLFYLFYSSGVLLKAVMSYHSGHPKPQVFMNCTGGVWFCLMYDRYRSSNQGTLGLRDSSWRSGCRLVDDVALSVCTLTVLCGWGLGNGTGGSTWFSVCPNHLCLWVWSFQSLLGRLLHIVDPVWTLTAHFCYFYFPLDLNITRAESL